MGIGGSQRVLRPEARRSLWFGARRPVTGSKAPYGLEESYQASQVTTAMRLI